jgi:Haem-degrading
MITLRDARQVIAAAESKPREIGQPMKIAVVDAGGNPILAAILLWVLVAAIAVSVWSRGRIGDAGMDRHGYLALVIGIVAALGLCVGLKGLVFCSSRHGYDEGTRRP